MCGILGQICLHKKVDKKNFESMLASIAHRGPDDSGTLFLSNHKIALGHRRLSFLDLSSSGKQPLSNTNHTVHITFNGEIYNYLELKEELKESYPFQTNTDTEVIVAAYEKWGIDCVQRLKGMFAFALLDESSKKLFLVRDRFGIKPLYYSINSNFLIFASELKAIMASGMIDKKIDFSSFADYFVYRYVPSPKTIWEKVKKLPPAHFIEIDTTNLNHETIEYWKLEAGNQNDNVKDVVSNIDTLLLNSVKEHTRADVSIGSFLSGGYDSSAMVYYMTRLKQNPDTFSIGFSNWQKSEDYFAKIVANHLNVSNESVIADESSLQLVEIMPDVYDEPIADISIVPTYMVSNLARKKVKAVLSGEGADEIFAGYTWQHDFYKLNNPESTIEKIKQFFKKHDTVEFYAQAMAMGWFDKAELKKMLHPQLHQYIEDDIHWFYRKNFQSNLSPLKSIQYMDMKCFMGELVLTKVDRASMANSLEVRVPFLDHELFQRIFRLNEKIYYKRNQTKFLLFENLKNVLPKEIMERKKQGFVGPDQYYMNLNWYKNELKNSVLVAHGIINQTYVDELLKETYNWKLWKILIMEKWFAKWVGK
jgi:asparagine synthase (glutamine-hydrolysing)